jgi:hypothetical protein
MEKNELRIGNWVLCNGLRTIVNDTLMISILKNDVQFTIDPIPLTPEILEKCGFVSNPYQDRYELGGLHFEYCGIRKLLWCEKYPHINSLHLLQNLVFFNTNTELTFKP